MPTQSKFERLAEQAARENYAEPTKPVSKSLPQLLNEFSLATQRMCRAFDRGALDCAAQHKKVTDEISRKIESRFNDQAASEFASFSHKIDREAA